MSGPERRDPPTWAIILVGLITLWVMTMITLIVVSVIR